MAHTEEERRERIAAQEAWENSPEGVYDNLSGPGRMDLNDPQMERMIVLAVAALPTEMKEFVYENCRFVAVGAGTYGQTLPPTPDRWLIILDATMTEKLDEPEILGIIAHEIAHVWFGHDATDPTLNIECEREAANLAATWGFTGIGADPALHSHEIENISEHIRLSAS